MSIQRFFALACVTALLSGGMCTPPLGPELGEPAKPTAIERLGPVIEAAAQAGPEALAAYFDWEALARRAAPVDMIGAERRGFIRGVRESLEGEGGMNLLRSIAEGSYTFRGVRWRDGRPVARFRFVVPSGGFNYHDLVLTYRASNEPRVIDMYVLLTGNYASEAMRGIVDTTRGDTSLLGRLRGDRGASDQELEQIREYSRLVREGSPEDALAMYERLPERLRSDRLVRILRVQAASRLEDQGRYLAVLDDTAAALPNDPALRMLLLDAHCVREQWAACFGDIAAIRSEYDDSYLDAFEGRLRVSSGDAEQGLALADRAIEAEDSLIDGHDTALLAALALGRDDRALAELNRLVADFHVDAAALASQPGYERILALGARSAPEGAP